MFSLRKRRQTRHHKELHDTLLRAQRNEITEYHVYIKLAKLFTDPENKETLRHIAEQEKKHFEFWKEHTGEHVKPDKLMIRFYILFARLFGVTFAVKLMEKGEEAAQLNYHEISKDIPEAKEIEKEEKQHEEKLLAILNEERLKYVGSMVLGVNDALVELTGALAGFTLALPNTKIIAMTGLITGIAASLSMAASEYLATKAESRDKKPIKAAMYTGGMYLVTVMLLIIPYFIFTQVYYALATTLSIAVFIIFLFTFYISVAQDRPFKKRFFEMAIISLGVAALSFVIGFLVKSSLNIEL